jgi:hypothetical protein
LSGQVFGEGRDYKTKKGFEHRKGDTKKYFGFRWSKKLGGYLARPGISKDRDLYPGNMNYMKGLASGYAVSKKNKPFYYEKKYAFVKNSWEAFKSSGAIRRVSEAVKAAYIRKLTSRAPEIEEIE